MAPLSKIVAPDESIDKSTVNCNDQYETLFNSVKNRYKLKENSSLSYEKGIIKLTNFGLNFIETCLS